MNATKVPMMLGATIYEFKKTGYSKFNAAILLRPELSVQIYHKLHLVPFGEYVPLVKALPWLIRLTPFSGTRVHFLDHGEKPAWFDLGKYRLAAAICFEDTVPQVVRRFFAEAPDGRQPDILINLSNDGWFHQTSEHEMHLAVSTFRCIENRVPLARAVNTGISAMVDGNGRILKSLAKLKEGVLIETTPLDDRVSLYSAWGDWLGLFCLAATIGLLVLGTFSPRHRKTDPAVPGRTPRIDPGSPFGTFRIPIFPIFPSLSRGRAWCRFTQVRRGRPARFPVVVHPRLVVNRLARSRRPTLSLKKTSRRGVRRQPPNQATSRGPARPEHFLSPDS